MSSLILPNGAPLLPAQRHGRTKALDMRFVAFDRAHRGIRILGSWLTYEPFDPCIVLLPVGVSLGKGTPCIVPLETAVNWLPGSETNIGETLRDFAVALGLDPWSPRDSARIVLAVQDNLSDLRRMPPRPEVEDRDTYLTGSVVRMRDEDGNTLDERDVRAAR